jgi:glycosyltransferase involved in cell wall biosynthesis
MKISFVLGIYNAERTIKQCIEAILGQNYNKKDYEIIVVDGGSQDNTVKIVKKIMINNKNIILLNNPYKLSEGKG